MGTSPNWEAIKGRRLIDSVPVNSAALEQAALELRTLFLGVSCKMLPLPSIPVLFY